MDWGVAWLVLDGEGQELGLVHDHVPVRHPEEH